MQSSKPQLKLNTRALPLFVLVLFALQLIYPYHGWVVLLVGLGGAWLIAFLWARSLARGLHLVREMRFGWAQVGDRLEERFTLVNQSWVPALWIEVMDRSTLPGYAASVATGVGSLTENSWRVKSVCTRRGAFTLGPTRLRTGDPFGIYTVTLEDAACVNMMVMPPIVPLPQIEVAPGGRAGEGRRHADALERAVSVSSVRDYQPGDGMNSIHWRVSAHRDELFVRLFDANPSSDWWIFLDLDQRVQVGQGQDSTLEHGVILAASLADRGLRLGHAVGLVAHGQDLAWFPPQANSARRWEILRALAVAAPGEKALTELLAQMQPSLKQRTSVIIITAAASGDWVANLLPLRRRGVVPTVLLLDPISFGGAVDSRAVLAALADMQITRYVVTRDVLDRPEAQPGLEGNWDWGVTPHGRVFLKHPSRGAAWKTLA